jgi:hypothetical protein
MTDQPDLLPDNPQRTEHHTEEQAKRAFAYAHTVLQKLGEVGLPLASIELFYDGSGSLHLNKRPTTTQATIAQGLVRSQRWSFTGRPTLDFCCGLVSAAEEAAKR